MTSYTPKWDSNFEVNEYSCYRTNGEIHSELIKKFERRWSDWHDQRHRDWWPYPPVGPASWTIGTDKLKKCTIGKKLFCTGPTGSADRFFMLPLPSKIHRLNSVSIGNEPVCNPPISHLCFLHLCVSHLYTIYVESVNSLYAYISYFITVCMWKRLCEFIYWIHLPLKYNSYLTTVIFQVNIFRIFRQAFQVGQCLKGQ
jgi:hypothetical protein